MSLTAIPTNFGSGGSGLSPNKSSGTPSLRDLLEEHRAAIEALQGNQQGGTIIAQRATTADHGLSVLGAVDGAAPLAGQIILVKSQADDTQNGLYVAAAGAWSRLTDSTGAGVLKPGLLVQVVAGTANADLLFELSSPDTAITEGVSSVAFTTSVTAALANTAPASLGVAETAGVAVTASRSDHVHAWAQKKTATITHADLTNAVNGSAETENVGTALPAGAIVVAIIVTLTTQFTGGGAASVALDVGWAGTTEALLKDFDAFGSTAGGAKYDKGASAASEERPVLADAKQVIATFTPDGGASLDGLTAGSVTIDVFYVVGF